MNSTYHKARIFVFGGSGFVGTSLCQRLSDHQVKFTIVDLKLSKRFYDETIVADIRNIDEVKISLKHATCEDIIIHLAAVHRDDVAQKEYHATNVLGTSNICEAATEAGIKKIIFTSSVAVYGFAPIGTDETGEVNPFNEYGRSKFSGEQILESWLADSDADRSLFIVRPTVIFGEGNRGNVYNLLNQIASGKFAMIGSGENVKSMAYVENVSAFLLKATDTNSKRTVVNYVDDPDMSMNTLVSQVRSKLLNRQGPGLKIPYWIGLILGYFADIISLTLRRKLPVSSIRVKKFCANSSFASSKSKIKNFIPPFSLAEALDRTIESEFISPQADREIFYTE